MSAQYPSTEENKNVVRRFWEEVFQRGNVNAADELFAPEWVLYDDREVGFFMEELRDLPGPAVVRELVNRIRDFFPDLQVMVEDHMDAEADRVITRFAINGTFEGRRVEVKGISISQVSGGKITGSWLNWESGLMYEQLGWFPADFKRPIWW